VPFFLFSSIAGSSALASAVSPCDLCRHSRTNQRGGQQGLLIRLSPDHHSAKAKVRRDKDSSTSSSSLSLCAFPLTELHLKHHQLILSPPLPANPHSSDMSDHHNSRRTVHDALLFECAWEVANKVGGIYTVIKTKTPVTCKEFGDRYTLIGPLSYKTAPMEVEQMDP
jgi:hypothetical protein